MSYVPPIRSLPARFLLPLALLAALTGCGTQAQTAFKVQEALQESLRRAQVDTADTEARQWADRAIADGPGNADTYYGPRVPDPASPFPQLSVAAVFLSVGDDPALADYMAQGVQKFPADERGYGLLADAQTRLGRTADRRGVALRAAALLTKELNAPGAQNIPVLTETLAQAYWYAGDAVNGAAEYKKVIAAYPSLSSYPNDLGPYNGLAYNYAQANIHLPEALALAQKALTLAKQAGIGDENIGAIQDTLGWVQYRQGDYADAEQNLLQAVNSDPRQAEIRCHLGLVYAAEGKHDAARAELGHAVLLSQGYAAARQALAALPPAPARAASL